MIAALSNFRCWRCKYLPIASGFRPARYCMSTTLVFSSYCLPLFFLWLWQASRRLRLEKGYSLSKQEAINEGLTEPASLHPLIDSEVCIGCRSCLNACPEQHEHRVLGLINGKAELIGAADCIGHGACKTACPVDAIALVFGTERRGVDIPAVKPTFETNVPGIYIAGELGGMGLIRNAIEQGRRAIESIARTIPAQRDSELLDVVIVGAGPAGFAASLAARERGLTFVTLEQNSLGGAISHYPRRKLTMLHARELPFFGKLKSVHASKEELLELFEATERREKLAIRYRERMASIARASDRFIVTSSRRTYATRTVLLALGRRGTPRKLDVPGEDASKVVYGLVDPAQYRGERVLVVGGGDSALEAAAALAEEPDIDVAIAYRSSSFGRAKAANRKRVSLLQAAGRLRVLFGTEVREIASKSVIAEKEGARITIDNDAVIVCAGGVPCTPLLQHLGIHVETKYGTA
jgi:thioredoxin reductase (NADPH)